MNTSWMTAVACLSLLATSGCNPAYVKRDEQVTFFPTAAYRSADQRQWHIPIHGWIYEPEHDSAKRWLVLQILTEALELDDDDSETPILHRRTRLFMVDDQEHRSIDIEIGKQRYRVGPSHEDGHFEAQLTLPEGVAQPLISGSSGPARLLEFRARTLRRDRRNMSGNVLLVEPEGLSIVSDIDDTIKVTEVADTEDMLENTFLKPFKPVRGMAELYGRWADAGATFHYLTQSPWQLYPELSVFMDQYGFPLGSIHMNRFDLSEGQGFDFSDSSRKHKHRYLRKLLERFPQRKFVMVGDSTQQDPEVYGDVAREFGAQVEHVFIRELGDDDGDAQRYREAFRDLPTSRWTIFRKPREIYEYLSVTAASRRFESPQSVARVSFLAVTD